MPRPPDTGFDARCGQCNKSFRFADAPFSRKQPTVRRKSACSEACAQKRRDKDTECHATDARKASIAKHNASTKRRASQKRGNDTANERARTDPAKKLKKDLTQCARDIWTGRCYVQTNTCSKLAERTDFATPSALLAVLDARAEVAGVGRGEGSIGHAVVPQDWFNYDNMDDVRRCWARENLDIHRSRGENSGEMWKLFPDRIAAHPAHLFPARFSKQVMLAAAQHDNGKDLHAQMKREDAVAAQAQAAEDEDNDDHRDRFGEPSGVQQEVESDSE